MFRSALWLGTWAYVCICASACTLVFKGPTPQVVADAGPADSTVVDDVPIQVWVSMRGSHGCISQGPMVRCWGSNSDGQVGVDKGTALVSFADSTTIELPSSVVKMVLGYTYTCAQLENQELHCWGSDAEGQTGHDTPTGQHLPARVLVEPPSSESVVLDVAAGYDTTCTILASKKVRCFGWVWPEHLEFEIPSECAASDECHAGSDDAYDGPLLPLQNVSHVSLGESHRCIVQNGTDVTCWDKDPLFADWRRPASLEAPVTHISSGRDNTCVVDANGDVRCWGDGQFGQTGPIDGKTEPWTTPIVFDSPPNPRALTISNGLEHTCARPPEGVARCWGKNDRGQLGHGTTRYVGLQDSRDSEVLLDDVVSISAGNSFTCAVTGDEKLACWGSGNSYCLGYSCEDCSVGLEQSNGELVGLRRFDARLVD